MQKQIKTSRSSSRRKPIDDKPKTKSKKRQSDNQAKSRTKMPSSQLVRNIMYVCRSCVWSETNREINGMRQGAVLLEKIKDITKTNSLPEAIDLRGVFCLNGCLSPCNISFRAKDKYTIRFSGLSPNDAANILIVAKLYSDSSNGNLKEEDIPKQLKGKISVRTPPLRH
ncbi:MAG: hypothetical protein CMM30_01970 [Rhodospirillaceae bacterium]|nr:hypothetical protein [Rhodospirillaceae bacterium]